MIREAPSPCSMRLSLLATILALAVPALAQTPGSCEAGQAIGTLDQSAVQASFPNTGTLFFGQGLRADYLVPKDLGVSPIYVASVWISGTVGGELRIAATAYGQGATNNDYFEFWPGPLDDGATLPNPTDCSAYDRIWVVSQSDVAAYESGQTPSDDLAEWPVGLGAPAVTEAGAPVVPTHRDQRIDLTVGERPVLSGTQTAFWVMNDVGNVHRTTDSEPLGVEVAVTAFGIASTTPAFNEATFYRYQITNRSPVAIDDMRVGFFADTDLGNASDDFVGIDTTRAMGFTYNADAFDEDAYRSPPPAFGVDILGGTADRTPTATSFMYFVNADHSYGVLRNASQIDWAMRGLSQFGQPMTEGGYGFGWTGPPTTFAFPGDPVTGSAWSEENNGDGRNYASDRRFALSSELGSLASGASATIDYALVYARGTDRLDSITALRAARDAIQAEYDAGTLFAPARPLTGVPPGVPTLLSPAEGAGPLSGAVELTWSASPGALNYLVETSESADFSDVERRIVAGTSTMYETRSISPFIDSDVHVYWRVTARRGALISPRTPIRSFEIALPAVVPDAYIVEIVGPGGADPCGPEATSTVGCPPPGSPLTPTLPGNDVYQSLNGTGAYAMTFSGPAGSAESLRYFAPNDFEIRVVPEDQGSYGYYSTGRIIRVPFQIWDIGSATPGEANDPSDDVRMVPFLVSDNGREAADECVFGFTGPPPFDDAENTGRATQRIYAVYPLDDYAAYETRAAAAVASAPDGCPIDATSGGAGDLVDFGYRPLQREVFVQAGSTTSMADLEGTVIRYYTREGSTPSERAPEADAGVQIQVAPNPARGRTAITIRLDRPGSVRLDVVDALGRRVARLADAAWGAGEQSVSVAGLAPGVYLAVLTTGSARHAIPFTIVR